MANLEVIFLSTPFANPLVVPSGIVPEISDSKKAELLGAGGAVTKSLTVRVREGNPMPRIIVYEHGYLNSVGLRNPGIKNGIKELEKLFSETAIPMIVSIFAVSVADFKKLAKAVDTLFSGFIELNLSCPNTKDELGESLGMGVESTVAAVAGVREAVSKKTKLIVKLSPNVSDIGAVAKAAESAGADAISAINTVGPGMVIDINTRKPKLGNKEGGVSGPGIRPIAVRCVYDIYNAVKIPIIGMGGVETWQDVVEMMLAGATLVGVGSAWYKHGDDVYSDICKGLSQYLDAGGLKIESLIGGAHT